ncbi:MAG: nucleoside triphosphate pyrophosphohydrolase [Gemmatimonadetes bacterium]|nr:nucleoside triphosphate pyrophosphohydrolase [Gemmatimonadota bacterium]MDE2733094.1 nucleoside triphosphate pyrophosphohydrolase [Gemmatimonadota bacterium]
MMQNDSTFSELVAIMARLRGPGGCPWDRKQTHATLRPYLLEEAYEALEAIDAEDDAELCKELGDVLLQVVFHAQIAAEEGRFDIEAVGQAIVDKLIRRHPHVFDDASADGADEVLRRWEQIKKQERREQGEAAPSLLEGIPKHLPALMHAHRIQARVSQQGFDWDDIDGTLDKVEEEFAEVRKAWKAGEAAAVEEEFGDLLFSLVNASRFLKVDPEQALRRAIAKFERRFRALEETVHARGEEIAALSLAALDEIWNEVKAREKDEE